MTFKTTQQKRPYGIINRSSLIPSTPYSAPVHQPSMLSSFKESLVNGLGTGIGFNIADRAISSVFGGRKVEVQHTTKNPECEDIISIYKKALNKGETISQTLEDSYLKCIKDDTI